VDNGASEYRVEAFQPEHRAQVIGLLSLLGGMSDPEAYFRWKYELNADRVEPLFYVVLRDGEVVGMRGNLGTKWEADGQLFRLPLSGDFVIAPDHRKKGLVSRIMEHLERDMASRGFPFLFNMSAIATVHLASLSRGWRGIGSLEPMVWRAKPGLGTRLRRRLRATVPSGRSPRTSDRAHDRSAADSTDRQGTFRDLDRRAGRALGRRITVASSPRPQAMADLIDRIGTDGRIRRVRDEGFFRWRFDDAVGPFRFLFWDDDELQGYLILRGGVGRTGPRAGILDWEGSRPGIKGDLLTAAIHGGRFKSVDIWSASLDAATKDVLSRKGFVPRPGRSSVAHPEPTVLVKRLGDEEGRGDWTLGARLMLERANWDLRMSYTDA